MNRKLAAVTLALALVAVTVACEPDEDSSTPSRGVSSAVVDSDTAGCPEGFVDAMQAWGDVGFNGTIAIMDGDSSCATSVGMRDPEASYRMTNDSVYAIGSVSKSFTAAAVMRLVADGQLELDDAAGSIIPELSGPAASATVEQLLTHTSGLHGNSGADHQPVSSMSAVMTISALPRTFEPGTDFGYTNAGYTLLALIVEKLRGDYRDFMMKAILGVDPQFADAGFWDGLPRATGPRAVGYTEAGRSEVTGQFQGPHWATSGNGDLAMSVPTLAGLTADLFRGELLPRRETAQITKARWDHGDGTSETFGWVKYGEQVFGAEGFASAGGGGDTGHNAIVAYLPDTDTAIAVASSTPEVNAEALLQAIVPALVAGEKIPEPAGAEVTAPSAELIDRVSGTYILDDGGELLVAEADEGVSIDARGDSAVDALFSLPDTVAPDDVAAHEAGVVELLTGDITTGEDEREALSEAVGGIEDVELQGTVADNNELRTYVLVTGAEEDLLLWYSLDDQGGVGAAQGPADPPQLVLDQQRQETLIYSDPTGRRSDVRVSVDENGSLTVDNGTTVVTAHRAS